MSFLNNVDEKDEKLVGVECDGCGLRFEDRAGDNAFVDEAEAENSLRYDGWQCIGGHHYCLSCKLPNESPSVVMKKLFMKARSLFAMIVEEQYKNRCLYDFCLDVSSKGRISMMVFDKDYNVVETFVTNLMGLWKKMDELSDDAFIEKAERAYFVLCQMRRRFEELKKEGGKE